MTAICPKCDQPAGNLPVETIRASYPGSVQYRTFVFLCPKCSCVLGVALDPASGKTSRDVPIQGTRIGSN